MSELEAHWLDKEYNALARLANARRMFDGWAARSALARAGHVCREGLHFGTSVAETLDVFPAQRPDAPVLVFIHGGFWRGSDKSLHSFLAPAFVARGAAVVLLNYGLCPAVAMETIRDQIRQALAWIYRNARGFNGDPRRLVVAGHSAGAHLAALMLTQDWPAIAAGLPHDLLQQALCISGLFDLEPIRRTPFLQPDLALTPESAKALSPTTAPKPHNTVVYTLVGALESAEFQRQNGLLRAHWGDATVPVCEAIPQRHHFDVLEDMADAGSRLHALAVQLLFTPVQPERLCEP